MAVEGDTRPEVMVTHKECSHCKRMLPSSFFNIDKRREDTGLQSWDRECTQIAGKLAQAKKKLIELEARKIVLEAREAEMDKREAACLEAMEDMEKGQMVNLPGFAMAPSEAQETIEQLEAEIARQKEELKILARRGNQHMPAAPALTLGDHLNALCRQLDSLDLPSITLASDCGAKIQYVRAAATD